MRVFNTPTKAKWQTVIDNLKLALPLATKPHHLDMLQTNVNRGYRCGTVHCMAGWYVVALMQGDQIDKNRTYSYDDGATYIAEALGFDSEVELRFWALQNPMIWGNDHGHSLFSDRTAYNYANTLHDIVAYLEGVRDRSPEF